MNPTRLTAENYRTFDRLDLTLPDGCVAVLGENGAGKTSIIQIVDLCLFAGRGELAGHLADAATGDLELVLEFEHRGGLYRVRRGFSGRGRGKSTLDFERLAESRTENGHGLTSSEAVAHWYEPLTRETAAATQTLIEETLGLSRQTFRASAFLAQGDGAAFTEAQPKDRKRILAEVLGLDVYARLLDRAKTDRRHSEDELARLDGETTVLREIAAGKTDMETAAARARNVLAQAHRDVDAAETRLTDLTDQWQNAQATRAELDQARAQLRVAEQVFDRFRETARDAAHAAEQIGQIDQELGRLRPLADRLPDLEHAAADLRARVDHHAAAVREHEAAQRELDLILAKRQAILAQASEFQETAHTLRNTADGLEQAGAGESVCDQCGQTLGAEPLAAAVAAKRTRADDLDAAAQDLHAQAAAIEIPEPASPPAGEPPSAALQQATGQLLEGREAAAQVRVLADRQAWLRAKAGQADTDTFKADYAHAEQQAHQAEARVEAVAEGVPDDAAVEELRRQGTAARGQADQLRTALQTATAEKALADERAEQAKAAETALAETESRRSMLQDELDLLAALERAYGPDGIPALIVENVAAPAIEIEAQRILALLGGKTANARIELRTQAVLKSGEGLRDTLDVIMVGEWGERPYEMYSGGERTRLNLALRIALARLLANRRGAESRLLAIDEPEYLDEAGVAKLAGVLRGLTDDFDKVYLISHVPALREAFDQTLTVVNTDGRSDVAEMGAAPEGATVTA